MLQSRAVRWALAVLGALAFAGILLALLVLINSGWGFIGCTGLTPFGWIIPLVAGIVLGLVVMLLMEHEEQNDQDGQSPARLRATTCASCNGPVIDEWRLCPHCGAMRTCDVEPQAPVGLTPTIRES